MVAGVLAGAYAAVNGVSLYVENADKRFFIPYMLRQRSGWRFKLTGSLRSR